MGIGRREFLRITGLAFAGTMIDPYLAVATNNDTYVNKKLGIIFNKPSNWGFIKVTDFGKLKDKQILGNGLDDIKDEVWEDLGYPICVATKYYEDLPENEGVFSPTITLNITPKEKLDELGHTTFEDVMQASAVTTSQLLEDFTIIKKRSILISGVRFYEFEASYLFEHIDLANPLRVELTVLKAEHNGFYYDFNFHQSSIQNQTANIEYQKFKQSIKLI